MGGKEERKIGGDEEGNWKRGGLMERRRGVETRGEGVEEGRRGEEGERTG